MSIADDDVQPVAGGVEDHRGIVPAVLASVRATWRRSAAAISSPVGSPPSARAASTQASPSPTLPGGAKRGAPGDQLGHRRDGLDAAGGGDPHETVRIEVVAEQHALALLARGEEPRAAVVDEVGLVDRLEPEREGVRRERREDRDGSRSAGGRSAAAQSGLSASASTRHLLEHAPPRRSLTIAACRQRER